MTTSFQIGETVELNGKTYTIVGTVARSFLVEDANGKKYKVTANMIKRITGAPDAQPAQHREVRDSSAADEHALIVRIQRMNMWNRSKPVTEPKTEDEFMWFFECLTGELSPENLTCDGECSSAEVSRRRAEINACWRALERRLGRKCSVYEIEAKMWARYQASRK